MQVVFYITVPACNNSKQFASNLILRKKYYSSITALSVSVPIIVFSYNRSKSFSSPFVLKPFNVIRLKYSLLTMLPDAFSVSFKYHSFTDMVSFSIFCQQSILLLQYMQFLFFLQCKAVLPRMPFFTTA